MYGAASGSSSIQLQKKWKIDRFEWPTLSIWLRNRSRLKKRHFANLNFVLFKMKELHAAGYSLLSIDSSGRTALHIAARYGQYEIVKYLVETAPSSILNMQENETGQTALHKATVNAHPNVCYLLVVSGASLTKADHAGYTPRQLALRMGQHDLASYLQSEYIICD